MLDNPIYDIGEKVQIPTNIKDRKYWLDGVIVSNTGKIDLTRSLAEIIYSIDTVYGVVKIVEKHINSKSKRRSEIINKLLDDEV